MDLRIRKRALEGTMCGGIKKTEIMSMSQQKLKLRFPRKMNLPVHKHRKYLRAKFKAEPESLNLREAKEWLEITLNDRQGSIRRRKRVQSLAKDKVKLERESEVKTATIVHMEHQENLVKKI